MAKTRHDVHGITVELRTIADGRYEVLHGVDAIERVQFSRADGNPRWYCACGAYQTVPCWRMWSGAIRRSASAPSWPCLSLPTLGMRPRPPIGVWWADILTPLPMRPCAISAATSLLSRLSSLGSHAWCMGAFLLPWVSAQACIIGECSHAFCFAASSIGASLTYCPHGLRVRASAPLSLAATFVAARRPQHCAASITPPT